MAMLSFADDGGYDGATVRASTLFKHSCRRIARRVRYGSRPDPDSVETVVSDSG